VTAHAKTKKKEAVILLLGAGRMGGALLRGWIASGRFAAIHVVEPKPSGAIGTLAKQKKITLSNNFDFTRAKVRAAVVALKPQVLKNEPALLKALGATGALIVSIAAGITTRFLHQTLGAASPVVRTVPNTPGAIGQGITALYASPGLSVAQRTLAQSLMKPLGETLWLGDERLMDAVTALSGSGPAYVFLLTETMTKAGISHGLAPDVSARLARATIMGAGALLGADPRSPEELRRDVTSPAGTTEAALNILLGKGGLEALMMRAITAATRRSRELGKRSKPAIG
jgi:pyrroline-5-carboxylate reductase